jgi:ribosome-associated toxin RatA of RatAB toxin-antitoxin module
MPTISSTTIVSTGPTEAFDFIADFRNIPRLQPHFTSAQLVGEPERGLGATVALDGRFHGFPMKARNRIIAYSPPWRLVSISEGAVLSRSTWEFEELTSDPPATRVKLTIDYSLRKVAGGLFMGVGSALWPLFNREIQGMTDESMRRLQGFFSDGKEST